MQFLRCHTRGCRCVFLPLFVLVFAAAWGPLAVACSSILVTRGASADGSVMITYACDAPGVYGALAIQPAADHKPGEMIEVGRLTEKDASPRGKIPQVAHTYRVLGLMNEHQLAVSESTFEGRPEAENPQGMLGYGELMSLMLQRAAPRARRSACLPASCPNTATATSASRSRSPTRARRGSWRSSARDAGERGAFGWPSAFPTARSPAMRTSRGLASSRAVIPRIASIPRTLKVLP